MKRLFFVVAFFCAALRVLAAGKAEHVVVVVWDGLRPDFVTKQNTPTLYQLAHDGVFFQDHHAVYPSSTEVNGTALATGAFPNRNGVVGNREYRPDINPLKRTDIEAIGSIVKGDELSGGHYLRLPTLPEILRAAGRDVAVAGTKPVTLLFDRFDRDHVKLYEAPQLDAPNTCEDEATTRALVDSLWTAGVPAFSLLWLSDPDITQHKTWPGSEKALAALKGADANLALVLRQLEAKGERTRTDVFIVSDHGFSTVIRAVDVADVLHRAGFPAAREYEQPPQKGDVVVVGNGGTVLLYVIGHDREVTRRIVEFLQQWNLAGVILTREPMPGTFTLEQVRINSPDAPDVVVSLRWTSDTNQSDIPGMIVSDEGRYGSIPVGVGRGGHSSLGPFDMRNTLVAAGPDFRHGLINELPSGNADLAPTILHILGVSPPERMDGRVLFEALASETSKFTPIEVRSLETSCDLSNVVWRQYLHVTEFNGTTYFDEGNGFSAPKK
jgi:arylsulfatase A-like enzyme